MKTLGLVLGLVAAFVLVICLIGMTISNQENSLRNEIKAQGKKCEAFFDQTWKIIAQQAQVKDDYRDSFRKIYPELMAGRYGNARGGALMSWVQESNPTFDITLYSKLMNTIEAQRIAFNREQDKLIDLQKEHNTLRQNFPGNIFVGSRPEEKITVITSAKTEEIYRTGHEDNIDLNSK